MNTLYSFQIFEFNYTEINRNLSAMFDVNTLRGMSVKQTLIQRLPILINAVPQNLLTLLLRLIYWNKNNTICVCHTLRHRNQYNLMWWRKLQSVQSISTKNHASSENSLIINVFSLTLNLLNFLPSILSTVHYHILGISRWKLEVSQPKV